MSDQPGSIATAEFSVLLPGGTEVSFPNREQMALDARDAVLIRLYFPRGHERVLVGGIDAIFDHMAVDATRRRPVSQVIEEIDLNGHIAFVDFLEVAMADDKYLFANEKLMKLWADSSEGYPDHGDIVARSSVEPAFFKPAQVAVNDACLRLGFDFDASLPIEDWHMTVRCRQLERAVAPRGDGNAKAAGDSSQT